MPYKPNILLIMADQMIPMLSGAYGHPVVQTPNLNRLVEGGVRFDAAYSSCPLCAPARASLFTGKYVSRIGTYDNAATFSPEEPTLCHYLSNAGYETIASGKLHYIGPDQLHGFRRRLTTDSYPASFDWLPTAKRKPHERFIDRRSHAQHYALPHVGVRPWSTYLAYDAETQFRALEWLYARGMRKDQSEPFFLTVSFHCPHDPLHVTQELWDLYEGQPIDIPQYPDNMEQTYSAMDRWLNAYHGTDRINIRDPQSLQAMRRSYYGLVTSVDRKVGEILEVLERTGLRKNTVIFFTSDHGDMLGEKNMVQKRSFYEFSGRVPLIVNFPDGQYGGTVCGQPVSLVDIAPTILEIAGVQNALPMDGASLIPCIEGREGEDREAYAEMHTNGLYTTCFMLRKGPYKYVYIHGETPQLFDLRADPGEWHNLAGNPAHKGIGDDLRARILNKFDPDAIEEDLQQSLLKRAVIKETLHRNDTHWDYQPFFDATKQYTR